jgi:hypothetical protein
MKAVAKSSVHWNGGANVNQIERTSETAATPKAIAISAREWRFKLVGVSSGLRTIVLLFSMDWLSKKIGNLLKSTEKNRATIRGLVQVHAVASQIKHSGG